MNYKLPFFLCLQILLFVFTYKVQAQSKLLFSEGFESVSETPFKDGIVKFKSGNWVFKNAAVNINPVDTKSGNKSIRIGANGKLSMGFDVLAKQMLWFEVTYNVYGNDTRSDWEVFISYNGGKTYRLFGLSKDDKRTVRKAYILMHPGKVRFEIRKLNGGSNSINIDDIEIRTSNR